MRRVVIILIFVGLSTVFVFGQRREVRSVSGFSGIDATGMFNIIVSKGNAESLTIEADDAVLQCVRSEVRNGVLHLFLDKNANGNPCEIKIPGVHIVEKNCEIKTLLNVYIVMRNLDYVSLSGACTLTSNDLFTPRRFKGEFSGASNLTANINAEEITFGASGATNIRITANVAGAAYFDISGASNFKGELNAKDVSFNVSGVSTVNLSGAAENFATDISGMANINAQEFVVKTADINSSAIGNVNIHVTGTLIVNSTSASTINYKGSPAKQVNISGAAKVRQM